MNVIEAALWRSLCYADAIEYPPTFTEWVSWVDVGSHSFLTYEEVITQARALISARRVSEEGGRMTIPGHESLIALHAERVVFMPRKLRAAKRVTAWLQRLAGVRFVALCNTTALGHARDLGDLDFFVVTQGGGLWQTRGWAALPFKLLNRRPRVDQEVADAVCLSFFVDDQALDLGPLALVGQDPYLRYWFLSLLPLYDDGIGALLWQQNQELRTRHPFAPSWMVNADLVQRLPRLRIPLIQRAEGVARYLQEHILPPSIQSSLTPHTGVVCNDHVLKFHVQDARATIRARYEERCRHYDVEP